MYAFSQEQIFILFLIIGICIGLIFDIFRATRKIFKTSDIITYIEDFSFMAIVGMLIINTLLVVNNGQIRFYIILAILFGILLYLLTLSKICFLFFQIFLRVLKKILIMPIFYVFSKIKSLF